MAARGLLEKARRFWSDGRGRRPGTPGPRGRAVAQAARTACQRCCIENMESRILLSTLEILAFEDANTRSGTNADLNYGAADKLMVKQESPPTNGTRYSFLKFDLSALPPDAVINTVQLQLWGWNGDMNENRFQTVNVAVYGVNDISWVEGTGPEAGATQAGTITWNTMPALIGSALDVQAIAPTTIHMPYAWEVSAWTGGQTGIISLGLKADNATADRAFFASRENSIAAERPRLVIIYNEPPTGAPASMSATGAPQSAVLNWSAVAGATQYNIYRSISPWDPSSWTQIGQTSELSFLSSGLTDGTYYSFRVHAANQFGESAQYAEAQAVPQSAPPAVVTSISVARSPGQVNLSWPASSAAQTYTIQRGTASGALAPLPAGTNITGTTFIDNTIADDQVYYYIITATNSLASVHSAELPVGAGLLGTYYDNQNFTNPMLTRIDPRISFSWGTGSPDPLIGPDTFSVHWVGQLYVPETTSYDFSMTFDDGGSLHLNGELIIERTAYSAAETTVSRYLEAGLYAIEVRHFEGVGGAGINLQWSYYSNLLGTFISKTPIPQHVLLPPDLNSPTGAGE
jgi:hypothetical protein